jgi:glycerol-3-phosphate dehydrogenase
MKRDIQKLAAKFYDVLIVGGGITGACIAWDASLRGLSVALIEKCDFGHATSSNSLKTVHGGLRYLQDGNLPLMRKMIRERKAFLRIAPHLVNPLPVVLPTQRKKFSRSLLVLGTAVKLNDLLSFDRNFGIEANKILPSSQVLSRSKCLELLPGLDEASVSGGILWYDAQIYNTEMLLISFIASAASAGALVANYIRATKLLWNGRKVIGVSAVDEITGNSLHFRSNIVVNAAGPWIEELLSEIKDIGIISTIRLSTAINVVTKKIFKNNAVGLNSSYKKPRFDGSIEEFSRVLFIAPWGDYSLIGTLHDPYQGIPDKILVNEEYLFDFIKEINRAYPLACLRREDIYHVHRGFLPTNANSKDQNKISLLRECLAFDHAVHGKIEGLITVVGVKYTTARFLAEKTVDLICKKMKQTQRCRTLTTPILGGDIKNFDQFIKNTTIQSPYKMSEEQRIRILKNYGSQYSELISYIQNHDWAKPVTDKVKTTKAEILHGIRSEMAQKLSDIVMRRTDLGSSGLPDEKSLIECACLMERELNWDKKRLEKELNDVYNDYSFIV